MYQGTDFPDFWPPNQSPEAVEEGDKGDKGVKRQDAPARGGRLADVDALRRQV